MSDSDALHRFLFEGTQVRGELVHLDASWRAVLTRHPYPETVRGPLGEALAATVLLTGTLKFDGALILQIQGEGPLRTLVAQATHGRTIRGLARWEGQVPAGTIEAVFGPGRLVLTLEPERGERYQGIVPLFGANLAEALETYFRTSEQLGTRLWLAAGPERAAGLLLQRLPESHGAEEDWTRVVTLADTLTPEELTGLPTETLLHRLFHEENLRLFEGEPVAFRCTCSHQRAVETIASLGADDVQHLVDTLGSTAVTCHFCGTRHEMSLLDLFGILERLGRPQSRN
mgnify:CR=1 FL=1